jgi:hypothetical protein
LSSGWNKKASLSWSDLTCPQQSYLAN